MGQTHAIKILSVALTPEERKALRLIAAEEEVSMSRVIREVLAKEFPTFREVHRPEQHRA